MNKRRLFASFLTTTLLVGSLSINSLASEKNFTYFSNGIFMADGNGNGSFTDLDSDILIDASDFKIIEQRYIDGNNKVKDKVSEIKPESDTSSIQKIVDIITHIKKIPDNLYYDTATIGSDTVRNVLVNNQYYPVNAHGGQIGTTPDTARSLDNYKDANANNVSIGKIVYADDKLILGNGKDVDNSRKAGENSTTPEAQNEAFTYSYHIHVKSGSDVHVTKSPTFDGSNADESALTSGGCYTKAITHSHVGNSNANGGCYTSPVTHSHTGNSSTNGGCYTSPVYHSHTGSSTAGGGCYGTAVYHVHTGSATSGGGCYTSAITHSHTGSATSGGGCYGTANTHSHTGSATSGGGCYGTAIYHSHTGSASSGGGCYGTPNYHSHTGSSSSGTGCYTSPNYHSHTGSAAGGGCYTTPVYHQHTGNSVSGGGCYGTYVPYNPGHNHSRDGCTGYSWYDETVYEFSGTPYATWHYYCNKCGANGENEDTTATHDCPYPDVWTCYTEESPEVAAHYELNCGRTPSVTIDYYALGCGKSTSTIESYSLGCGKTTSTITGYSLNCGKTTSTITGYSLNCGKSQGQITGYSLNCGKSQGQITGYNLGCGKTTSTIDSYALNCGKTTSTIVSYALGCGMTQGQIIRYDLSCGMTQGQILRYEPGCNKTHGHLEKIEVNYTKIN